MIAVRSLPHRKVTCALVQKKAAPSFIRLISSQDPLQLLGMLLVFGFLEQQNCSSPDKIKISNDLFSLVICMSRMKLPASEATLKLSDRHYHVDFGEQPQIFVKQPSTPLYTPKHDHVIKEGYLVQFFNSLSAWVS